MAKPRGILGQAGPLLLGRLGATVLGFALPLILTRLLPQSEFGTYKQVWLVVTTGFFMLQLGIAQSLYYFVPRKDGREQAWLTQSIGAMAFLGSLCAAAIYLGRFRIAAQFANPEIASFGAPMALIALTMILTAPLEITLTAEGNVKAAAWIIFLSDALRVTCSVVPLLMGWGLQGFFWAYVVHGVLRTVATSVLLFRRGAPQWDWTLFRRQLVYALPFGAAILLDVPQKTFHQWAVGWSVDPAMFAIYAQGCFQLPIVNLLYSPISDVLQVRMAEPGSRQHHLHLFHDANQRLAAVFFPFTCGMVAAGALFIPALFTHRYDASIPIFRIAVLTTPFACLPLEGVMRALGRTRYLFNIFFWKLLVTVPAVLLGLKLFGMAGAIAGHGIAESAIRVAMLNRTRKELNSTWAEILPWRHLALLGATSLVACVPVVIISHYTAAGTRPFLALCASGAAYAAVYLACLGFTPGSGTPVAKIKRILLGVGLPQEPAISAPSQAAVAA
jgi:O-antigen/teichoic acid export membrane protein